MPVALVVAMIIASDVALMLLSGVLVAVAVTTTGGGHAGSAGTCVPILVAAAVACASIFTEAFVLAVLVITSNPTRNSATTAFITFDPIDIYLTPYSMSRSHQEIPKTIGNKSPQDRRS